VIHDRDAIYSKDVDLLLKTTGLQILETPTQSPQAHAFCERLIGTIRRECLDFIIPLSGSHSCANDPERLGSSLQSRTSTFEPGTGNTRGCHFSEH
jgi:hypothetical protein